jgi:hypothetical protein
VVGSTCSLSISKLATILPKINVSDRAIDMFGAWPPARHAISSEMPSTRRHMVMLAVSEIRAMSDPIGAGQESASTTIAATIPTELAESTRTRSNANRGVAMWCPGWKCGPLFVLSHPSATRGIE